MAKTLLHTEQRKSRGEIAAYLRQIANKLDSGDTLTLQSGNQDVDLTFPGHAEFEVKVEQERSFRGRKGETSLELEIEWDEQQEETTSGLEIM